MNAWKLPTAILALLVINFMMAGICQFGSDLLTHFGLLSMWRTYSKMWFAAGSAGWPVWVLCYLALLTCVFRYYRTGTSGWGWLLALSGILCSTTGAHYLRLLF